MKSGNWIKSPWTIGIATTILGFLLSMLNDNIKDVPVLTTIGSVFNWIGHLLWTILDFDIKVWWIILAIMLLILALWIYSKLEKKEITKPEFCEYREDNFTHWKWTWNWEYSNTRSGWVVTRMEAHCPKCHTPMMNNASFGLNYTCPRCDYSAINDQCDNPVKIERVILDNIDRRIKKNSP